jgi:murein DD-endopeptidase MepM/ murein hydrolase activator NlpD
VTRWLAALLLWAVPVHAEAVFDTPLTQGGLAVGHVAPGTSVTFDERKLRVSSDGLFVLGFSRDVGRTATLTLISRDGTREMQTLTIAPRKFDIQRIDGLPERQVTPNPADLERIKQDNALVAAARLHDGTEALFRRGFIWPVTGPISGIYGSQRILNGQPRSPHWGVDIAAAPGSPIVATADAVVTMVHQDMFLTGKTVLLDHGFGVNSVYFHMSEITVTEGERVKQGQVIGKVGATGRATGPHLHWGLNLFDVRLDPALVVPPMPKSPGG